MFLLLNINRSFFTLITFTPQSSFFFQGFSHLFFQLFFLLSQTFSFRVFCDFQLLCKVLLPAFILAGSSFLDSMFFPSTSFFFSFFLQVYFLTFRDTSLNHFLRKYVQEVPHIHAQVFEMLLLRPWIQQFGCVLNFRFKIIVFQNIENL